MTLDEHVDEDSPLHVPTKAGVYYYIIIIVIIIINSQ